MERGFLDARAAPLAAGTSTCARLSVLLAAVGLALVYTDASSPLLRQLRNVRSLVMVWLGSMALVLMVLVKVARCTAWLGPHRLEYLVVGTMQLAAILLAFSQPRYAAALLGLEPGEAGAADAGRDETLVLLLDGLVTVSHLLLPVRWSSLWPFELAVVGCYAAPTLLWGVLPLFQKACHLALLAVLVGSAAAGKRAAERHERAAFVRAAQEKTMRFEVEHRLEQMTASAKQASQGGADDDDNESSMSATTCTGELFKFVTGGQADGGWDEVLKLGYEEQWLVRPSELRVQQDQILGVGRFAVVLPAVYHGAKVVLKAPRAPAERARVGCLAAIVQDLRCFRRLRHPNIVLFYGACIDPATGEMLLVVEYIPGVHLEAFVRAPPASPETADRCRLASDVCCALRYLHAQEPSIVHGDIRGSNVLVEQFSIGPVAKLVDFGLSRLVTKRARPLGATLNWLAPEVVLRETPSPSADVFSFGRLLYLIVTGCVPLRGVDGKAILASARKGQVYPLAWPASAPLLDECQDLSGGCCLHGPRARPSMLEVHKSLRVWALRSAADGDGCQDSWDTSMDDVELADGVQQLLGRARRALELQSPAVSVKQRAEPAAKRSRGGGARGRGGAHPVATLQPIPTASTNRLALPHFPPTPEAMKDLTIAAVLNTWNTAIHIPGFCCSFHAVVAELHHVHARMQAGPCKPRYQPHSDWQCPRCKVMDLLQSAAGPGGPFFAECHICGYEEAFVPEKVKLKMAALPPAAPPAAPPATPASPNRSSGVSL